ncbi:MAG: thrombospondin type-1 domain-containing protein [Candidatus Moraniibacteriota bacterium]
MKKIVLVFLLVFALFLSARSVSANIDSMTCVGYVSVMTVQTSGGECGGKDCDPKVHDYPGSPYSCTEAEMATGASHTIHHFTRTCKDCRCKPNCDCANNTLVGDTCDNGCGGSCSGKKSSPGVCGSKSKVYNATDTVATWNGDSWCSIGSGVFPNGAISFPNQGEYTPQWSCTGIGGGATTTNCQASRKLGAPTSVDLVIQDDLDDNVSVNKLTTSSIKKEWSSANATHCEGSGVNWHSPRQLLNDVQQLDPPGDFNATPFAPRTSSSQPNYSTIYNLYCYNQNGTDTATRSSEISDAVTVTVNCGPVITYGAWGDCSKECGGGTRSRTITYPNCFESIENGACNTDPCPVSSSIKEVRP